MNREFYYSDTFGKVRDFYLALSVSMNNIDFKKDFIPTERGDLSILEAHKRFSAAAEPYRRQLSVFFASDKNKPGFLVNYIVTDLPRFSSPASTAQYLKSIPAETIMVELLRFYDKKSAREFYTYLVRDKELLLSYIRMFNLNEEIKSGLLIFVENPDRLLKTLFELFDVFLPLFEREYAICLENTASYANEVMSKSYDEINMLLRNDWIFKEYSSLVDKICISYVMFLPKSMLYMIVKGALYLSFGYKIALNNERHQEQPGPTDIFKPFSDKVKFRIIQYLSDSKKRPVNVISRELGIPVPTMSHHLVSMYKSGMLHMQNVGKKNLYFIHVGYIDRVNDYLESLSAMF